MAFFPPLVLASYSTNPQLDPELLHQSLWWPASRPSECHHLSKLPFQLPQQRPLFLALTLQWRGTNWCKVFGNHSAIEYFCSVLFTKIFVIILVSPHAYYLNIITSLSCHWSFQFQFTSFNLENALHHDYVMVRNGPRLTSPLMGRYTGNENPGNVGRSMTNNLLVEFHTDGSTARQGFRAVAARHTRGREVKYTLLNYDLYNISVFWLTCTVVNL